MIAVSGHLMPLCDDRLGGGRISLRNPPAGVEGRLDALLLENPQNPPNRGVRTVFALRVFLVVHLSVRTGPDVLAALEIERQADRDPAVVRPREFAVMVVFLKHHLSLLAF